MHELRPVPGVRAVVEELRARGAALAVASQSPLARVRFSLEVTGLAQLFGQHLYVTSMVARPKPAPDVYLLAASRLGVRPQECVVVEDSPAEPRRPSPPACGQLAMHLTGRLTPCAPAARW